MDKKLKELFVTYEIALGLKEIGFNEGCLGKFCRYNSTDDIELFPESQNFFKGYFNFCYNEHYIVEEKVAAPLWQQAILFLNKVSNEIGSYSYGLNNIELNNIAVLEFEILKVVENLKKLKK